MNEVRVIQGDCRAVMAGMPAESVHCCITSSPYFGLRSYGTEPQIWGDGAWRGELGQEPSPQDFIAHLVDVFAHVHRVLRADGLCWVVIGDSYAHPGKGGAWDEGRSRHTPKQSAPGHQYAQQANRTALPGLKAKDLMLIPQRLAIALQEWGWYVRNEVIWEKASCMPESVRDRLTRSHETVWMLAKSERYYFSPEAIAEPVASSREYPSWEQRKAEGAPVRRGDPGLSGDVCRWSGMGGNGTTRNKRTVWRLGPEPLSDEHYAAFPQALVEPMILASTSERGCCAQCGAPWRRLTERTPMVIRNGPKAGHYGSRTTDSLSGTMLEPARVRTAGWGPSCNCGTDETRNPVLLDPFGGSGTVGVVAKRLNRDAILIDLNPEYCRLAEKRIGSIPLPLPFHEALDVPKMTSPSLFDEVPA